MPGTGIYSINNIQGGIMHVVPYSEVVKWHITR